MVSRLFGKLDAHRQRTLGSDGVCATACETAAAPAAAAALPAMNLRRFMCALLGFEGGASLFESIPDANDREQVRAGAGAGRDAVLPSRRAGSGWRARPPSFDSAARCRRACLRSARYGPSRTPA